MIVKEKIFEEVEKIFTACLESKSLRKPPSDMPFWMKFIPGFGYTDMTIWSAPGEGEGNIEAVRSFRLEPGQAGLFDVREIHSIEYPPGSKFVRVTGVDMSQETRRVFDPETGTVQEIEHAGTGKVR